MSLDIAEPQILVYYEDDGAFQWHMRVLLRRLRDAVWVWVTPDLELEVQDVALVRLLPLARAAAFPGHVEGNVYAFAAGALDAELAGLHGAAARMAAVLGGGVVAPADVVPGGAQWRIADPSSADFGKEVADDIVQNAATGLSRGAVGIARCGTDNRWWFVERVPNSDVATWEEDKHSGAGRDVRLAGGRPAKSAPPTVDLGVAVRSFRAKEVASLPHWPHLGPRAIVEITNGILGLGLTFATYHEHWVRSSGAQAESAVCHEHKMLCQVLGLSICYDRLDPTNVAGLELAGRRLIMIERAVRVNPKAPSFAGLGMMVQHALDEGGGVATAGFTAHMADMAEKEARVLKQNRLLREEIAAKKKEGGGGGGGGRSSTG